MISKFYLLQRYNEQRNNITKRNEEEIIHVDLLEETLNLHFRDEIIEGLQKQSEEAELIEIVEENLNPNEDEDDVKTKSSITLSDNEVQERGSLDDNDNLIEINQDFKKNKFSLQNFIARFKRKKTKEKKKEIQKTRYDQSRKLEKGSLQDNIKKYLIELFPVAQWLPVYDYSVIYKDIISGLITGIHLITHIICFSMLLGFGFFN